MRNFSGHQCKAIMSGSEKKVNENTYSRCRNVEKKVCCTSKVAFLLIITIVVFHRSPALPSPISITRFYILFEKTINIIESFAFSPG